MKKWLLIIGIILVAGSVYLLIPAALSISTVVGNKCSLSAADRYFTDTSQWGRWWPRDKDGPTRKGAGFAYGGYTYTVTDILYNQVRFRLQAAGDSLTSGAMQMIQVDNDSILMGGECVLATGYTPWARIQRYRRGKEIRENMAGILRAFKAFTQVGKNIYGVNIVHAMSDDSILVTLSGYTPAYPTTEYIYTLIDTVRKYVEGQGALAHNYPMLNVALSGDGRYRTMVALSVNKRLEDAGRILVKRFVPWKMIEGDVQGGAHTADKAMGQLYKFRDDYHLSIMSIPFEFLITDRRQEPDTTKWVTRVCAPIS
jgi:hypothetical protein